MSSSDEAFGDLAAELVEAFTAWDGSPRPWPERRLDRLARRTFRVQVAGVEPYRRWCQRRGVGPDDVAGWKDVPAVPTAAFRELELCVGGSERAALTFRTSGTSRGRARRGRHPVREPALYRASLRPAFRRFVLAGERRARILSLHPPFGGPEDGESSLAWMLDDVVLAFGTVESVVAASAAGLDVVAATRTAERAAADGVPLVILGTTLALDTWLRALAQAGSSIALPAGSRAMDTGGAKGRKGLRRTDVLDELERRLGVTPERVVNEFGMTELLSQRYGAGAGEDGEGPLLRGPPWLRTRALDPVSLAELPEGEEGLLCHYDLANAGSVAAVLTEDLGRMEGDAVRYRGRMPGASPRGCSLATAELLEAQRRA